MIYRYTLPIRLVSVANTREHWSAKARRAKAHRQAANMLTPAGIDLPAVVTFTKIGAGTLDADNLANACKSAQDGVADALGIDDASPLVEWRYQQRKAKRGIYGCEVEIVSHDESEQNR